MKTALISVYNKEGIVDFAKELVALGFKILASGGTAKELTSAGLEVTDVASLVGGGAILGHRVVTLSREVHAGLLARDIAEDREELKKLKLPWIDLVCVDLYPLSEEIEKVNSEQWTVDSARDAVLEKTDIGGPTMIRSAAKGRRIVVCDPSDRGRVIEWLKNGEKNREEFITSLAAKAEFVVADYALTSARYHSRGMYDGFLGTKVAEPKYGENAWQNPAGLYTDSQTDGELSPRQFKVLAGIAPSYNNFADLDRLLQTVTHIAAGFDVNFGNVPKIAVGVKHGNPCGAAVSDDSSETIKKMLEGDLRAIFGGVVMVNFPIDEKLAEVLLTHKMDSGRRLLDGIIAPSFTDGAVEMMKRKGDKCRFIVNNYLVDLSRKSLDNHSRFRHMRGGFLMQPNYNFILDLSKSEINGKLSAEQKCDVILAWAIGSTSNSNTVTLVKDNQLLGNGVGQQDRVGCCQLAKKRATDANHELKDATAYSDSFFPFVDGVETLVSAGIKTIFATSGSVRDEEIKKFCADKNVTLVMLPDVQARGFFGH